MRHLTIVALACVLIFASCSLQQPEQTGSILIDLPVRASAQSVSGIDYDIARIRLTSGSTRLPIQGYEFLDVSEDSVTIDGLLPDTYAVRVSFGQVTDDDILYSVTAYGESEQFSVSAGVTSRITIGLTPQTVFTVESTIGTGFTDVVTANDITYTLDELGRLYRDGDRMNLTALGNRDVQSITLGSFFDTSSTVAEELWINTDQGIVPYRNDAFDLDFSAGMTTGMLADLDIQTTFTHLALDDSSGTYGLIIIGQGSGLDTLFGAHVKYADRDDPTGWDWMGWSDIGDVAGLDAIQDALEGVGEVIYDLVVDENYLYVATALQTFFLSSEDLDELIEYVGGLDDIASELDLDTVLGYFGVVSLAGATEQGMTIKQLEVENSLLYLGTNTRNDPRNGVLTAGIDPSTGAIVSDAEKIAETEGITVLDIIYNSDLGKTAVIGASTIVILEDGEFYAKIPYYAGLPGNVRSADWDDDQSRLYLAGEDGVAYLQF